MADKLNKVRAKMQTAQKVKNEWKKQFYLMREQRDNLKEELRLLKEKYEQTN